MPNARKKPNGTWTLAVQYKGQRRNLTLGKLPRSRIDYFCANVESLIEHAKYGGKCFPPKLQAWIDDLADRHKIQLSEIGLFDYRTSDMTVGELCDKYLADYEQRSGISKSTKNKVRSTINNRLCRLAKIELELLEPVRRSIRQNADPIWSDEALKTLNSFNSWQRNYCSVATWSRDNKLLSSIGIWAVKQGFCDYNPFTPLPSVSMVNDERNKYLTTGMVRDAMNACLSPDIRITIALGRFAGLRTCSEIRTLKWRHVDTKARTLTVIDSKKKAPRVMPLFDHVLAELEKQREITGKTRFVATVDMRSTSSAANYDKICDAIRRSGQEVWPRVRQNLRSSCENDLLETFEERLVTQWVGHTVSVSRAHYQKLRPSDYLNAVQQAAATERN